QLQLLNCNRKFFAHVRTLAVVTHVLREASQEEPTTSYRIRNRIGPELTGVKRLTIEPDWDFMLLESLYEWCNARPVVPHIGDEYKPRTFPSKRGVLGPVYRNANLRGGPRHGFLFRHETRRIDQVRRCQLMLRFEDRIERPSVGVELRFLRNLQFE